MKFGATHSKHRHAHTMSALPSKQRHHRHGTASTSTTSWEQRIMKAKKLTASRRTDEQLSDSAGKACAAYLQWLEQRTARIEELRVRIETGTYHVDSATLATDLVHRTSERSDREEI